MITDRQVRKLFELLSLGKPLRRAALLCEMSEKTARRYRTLGTLSIEFRTTKMLAKDADVCMTV